MVLVLTIFVSFAAGQRDPDPNSPTPELLSGTDKTRVLAVNSRGWDGDLPETGRSIFRPSLSTSITIFVSGVELLPNEGANAIRVYLNQRSGKTFELKTEQITPVYKNISALRVRVWDPTGFRGQPAADGDSLIYVTWRGMKSNTLKIGLGSTAGGIKIPAPPVLVQSKEGSTSEAVGYLYAGDRVRFLEQAAFGPSTTLDQRLRRIGLRTWLAEQFQAPYPSFPYPDPAQMQTVPPTDCSPNMNPECYRGHYTMIPLQQWFYREAMYGEGQLRHRIAWTLGQIWVTSGVSVQQASHAIAYHKILNRNAFGKYRELMHDVTLSPTMGSYLDMARSTKTNPNENYPREILQLFTIGLYLLNQDGTRQLGPEGNPIPTYTQEHISNLSKVFTGWTYCNFACPNSQTGIVNHKDPMVLNPANHDLSAKTLLSYPGAQNTTIPACTNCNDDEAITAYANDSLKKALDNIFNHPNVGPFVGKLLIQHLVTSDPSPAYVTRVAAAFNDNGAGERGDLKAVIRTILLDPEARGNLKTDPRYGKLREPVQLVMNLARIFTAKSGRGGGMSDGELNGHIVPLGQDSFKSPSVFNYYSPDNRIPGTTVLAPEFEILNTGTASARSNLLHSLVFEGLISNSGESLRGTELDYTEFLHSAITDPTCNQLLDLLNQRMMHGAMLQVQKDNILTALKSVPDMPLVKVQTAVYLIAVSSQYQIQR